MTSERFLTLLVLGSLIWNCGFYLAFKNHTNELTRQNKIYAEYFSTMTKIIEEVVDDAYREKNAFCERTDIDEYGSPYYDCEVFNEQ